MDRTKRTWIRGLVVLSIGLVASAADAQNVPRTLNIEGVLRNVAGEAVTGTPAIRFHLFPTANCLGTEQIVDAGFLPVIGGAFSQNIDLSTLGNYFADKAAAGLQVEVDGAVLGGCRPLASVAFALKAEQASTAANALLLGGQDRTYYESLSGGAGPVDDSRLSAKVVLRDDPKTISGVMNFAPATGNIPFTVSPARRGTVVNLGADLLDGLDSTAFLQSIPMASDTVLGGVKVGPSLTIDGNGVLGARADPAGYFLLASPLVPQAANLNITGTATVGQSLRLGGTNSYLLMQGASSSEVAGFQWLSRDNGVTNTLMAVQGTNGAAVNNAAAILYVGSPDGSWYSGGRRLAMDVNGDITGRGDLRLVGSGSNFVGFKAPAGLAATKVWSLPAADGTTGQVLRTDGSGNLGFVTVADGRVGAITNGQWCTAVSGQIACTTNPPITGVTAVGLVMPPEFSVANSPVTSSGTLTASWASAPGNSVFAGPAGVAGLPAFRGLVASDIPNLDASKITTGVIPAARLGAGTANNTVFLRGDGTWAPITTQASTPPFVCNDANGGAVYYDSAMRQVRICNGTNFVDIGPSGNSPAGATNDTALGSCEEILAANPTTPSGAYWIDPTGGGTATSYQVYCLMNNTSTIDGGGWTLALNIDPNDGVNHGFRDTLFWGGVSSYGSVQAAMTADYKSAQAFTKDYRKLLVMVHKKGQMLAWREWYLPRSQSLQTQFSLPNMVQTTIGPYTNNGPWYSNSMSGNMGGSRGGPPLTAALINSYNGGVSAYESIVSPGGGLRVNMNWGADGSPDGARVRSDTFDSALNDNTGFGLGTQMDVQGLSWSNTYTEPGCDVGTSYAWANHFCVGSDATNLDGNWALNGSAKDLGYSYAIFVKDVPATPNAALIGNSAATAAQTCEDLLARRSDATSGTYYIDPSSPAGSPNAASAYQVYCQMDIDGGGWALAMNLDTGDGQFRGYKDAIWTGATGIGTAALALHGDYKSAEVFGSRYSKIMIMIHRNGTGPTYTATVPVGSGGFLGWRSWNLLTPRSLREFFTTSTAARWPYARLTNGLLNASVGALAAVEAVVRPAGDLVVNAVWGAVGSWDMARIRTSAWGACTLATANFANASVCDTDDAKWGLGTQMNSQDNGGTANTIAGYLPGGTNYPYCDAASINAWGNAFCFGGDKWCPACGDSYNQSTAWPDEQTLSYDYAIFVKGAVLGTPDTSLLGNSSGNPAATCAAIKTDRPTAPSGLYWLSPGPYQAWCDMDIDGGGWVLAMNLNTSDGAVRGWADTTFWQSTTGYGNATNPWLNDYKQQTVMGTQYSKIMIRIHRNDYETIGWRSWALKSSLSMFNIMSQATSTTAAAALTAQVTTSTTGADVANLMQYEAVVRPAGQLSPNYLFSANDYGRLTNLGQATRADNYGGALGYTMDLNTQPAWWNCDASQYSYYTGYPCFGQDKTGNNTNACGLDQVTNQACTQEYQYDYAIYFK